jgi:hypothetical protein
MNREARAGPTQNSLFLLFITNVFVKYCLTLTNKNNCFIFSRCVLFDFGKIKLEFLTNFKYQTPVKLIKVLSKQTRFFKNPKILNIEALQQQLDARLGRKAQLEFALYFKTANNIE